MIAWPAPDVPTLPGAGCCPTVHDTATGRRPLEPGESASVYVCGITPYDATHLGHAATYVTFDVLIRVLRDAGVSVTYAQNVTDVDDPLLERARRDGVDWRDLATCEIELFRDDMTALSIIPPDHYVGVVESIPLIARAVHALLEDEAAYRIGVEDEHGVGADDLYLDLSRSSHFGAASGWSEAQMDEVFADRGGDPSREGKRSRFDPLLWRAAREGEPSWSAEGLPDGRPGWHIECTAIATDRLGTPFTVQGGGSDLVFPHHEMSAVQADALFGAFAQVYLHQAMVGLHGEKMSKSKGNLVLVSRLRHEGVDPAAIRLGLLAHHYRTPWDWTDDVLAQAQTRLATWREAHARGSAQAPAAEPGDDTHDSLLEAVRGRLSDDLDTPGALAAIDEWIAAPTETPALGGASLADITSALLGVPL